ncbi:MAG: chemotaxis protein CheA [Pseudomonadota bacterium]
MTDPMAEIRASFFVECEELLESLNDGLAAMEDGGGDGETINVVFRAVHSIKGGAGAFGLSDLVNFAHIYETVLDRVRSGDFTPEAADYLTFFSSADVLSDLVKASRDGDDTGAAINAKVLGELQRLEGGGEGPAEEAEVEFVPTILPLDFEDEDDGPGQVAEVTRVRFRPHAELFQAKNEPLFIIRCLEKLGKISVVCETSEVPDLSARDGAPGFLSWLVSFDTAVDHQAINEVFEFVADICDIEVSAVPLETPNAEDASPSPSPDRPDLAEPHRLENPSPQDEPTELKADTTPAAEPTAQEAAPMAAQKATVRVDLEKIDRLVNLVGELVINQAMLSQSVAASGIPANSAVAQGLEEFMQLTRDVQDSVMMIRAQPVKSLFQRMSRIVREASASIDKNVRLKTSGETTEVDKTVIERLADPLTHMIRNAVDHGLEQADVRAAAGKPAVGTVSLSAAHRSGRVIIEVSDDGAGINGEKVLKKAIEKGLVSQNSNLTPQEIDNLLFLPGFSTATEVSSLSGRGVGMDVVKSAITSLGGRVSISSIPGKGTTFSISLPLTLAVLDGMVVEVAGETLVVPLNAILETLTVTDTNLKPLGATGNVIEIRGGFAPLIDLGVELGYRGPKERYQGAIALVIGHEDGSRGTLVVDAIQDQRQVVIKGLQPGFGDVRGIAAATILGDGQIALILDPITLAKPDGSAVTGREPQLQMAI